MPRCYIQIGTIEDPTERARAIQILTLKGALATPTMARPDGMPPRPDTDLLHCGHSQSQVETIIQGDETIEICSACS